MLDVNGYIQGTASYAATGEIEHMDYSWHGGPIIGVSERMILRSGFASGPVCPGSIVTIGQFRLRIIEDQPSISEGYFLAMRDGWRAWIRERALPSLRWMDTIYRRLVITASIWGMARYYGATYPSWRDVYVLNAFAKALAKARDDIKAEME